MLQVSDDMLDVGVRQPGVLFKKIGLYFNALEIVSLNRVAGRSCYVNRLDRVLKMKPIGGNAARVFPLDGVGFGHGNKFLWNPQGQLILG